MKRILLKTIILFSIILPLYMYFGSKKIYAYDCGRCSTVYKHAYANWDLVPGYNCDDSLVQLNYVVTYTCNCSCMIWSTDYWNTSCHNSCCPGCTPPACSTLGTYWSETPCSGEGCSTDTTQCSNVESCYDWTGVYEYRTCYEDCGSCNYVCPSGTTTTNTGCDSNNYACYDDCNDYCGSITCYDYPVTTSAPSTPTYSGIRTLDGSYSYNQLSTSSSSPTAIDFSSVSGTWAYTTTRPSNGGYDYEAYNAFTSGTRTLNYTGTTQYQSFTNSEVGRVESRHYQYRCSGYSGTQYWSGTRYGYYCDDSCDGSCTPTCPGGMTLTNTGPDCTSSTYSSCSYSNDCSSTCNVEGNVCYYEETNTPPASPPTTVKINVNSESYTLSTSAATPTKIKYPPAGATITVETSTGSGIDGYKFVADNYGVSDQWAGGTECQGVIGEDFCSEGSSNTQAFDPYNRTPAQVLLENAEGEISAYYYTENDCDSDKEYSSAITGYYIVMPIPTASYYEIEVNTASDFTGSVMWDSGKTSMTTIDAGQRSSSQTYAGSTLSGVTTYYWRIKFWDQDDNESPWSSTANFEINRDPTAPTSLQSTTDNPPVFSAIYNDPDSGDTSSYYEIEANTASDFTGTVMWDSGKTSMTTTNQGSRSPDITYAGDPLSINVIYYWRIRFWDSDDQMGAWSTASTFGLNVAPNSPTNLLTEGETNPTMVSDTTPEFSAIYDDDNTADSSSYYEIEVNTASDFNGTVMWDSTKTSMTTINEGERCSDISYAGTALTANSGTTYYWRIKFWDADDEEGSWSTTATFQLNTTPNSPTNLLTEGSTNPDKVGDTTPEFSAVFDDPDTSDSSSYYEIEVNTASDFSGTVMWDSTKTSMTTTNEGDRSPDISYAGTPLSATSGNIYYWRIKFWDAADAEGSWSTTANFTMNNDPTAPSNLLTEGQTNPQIVSDLFPEFSAIFNDTDTSDTSSYYEIEVNTASDFTGTVMWDSGKTSMTTTEEGERCSDITYDGDPLSNNFITYYWRIKFWDAADTDSSWSSTANFKTSATRFWFDGLLMNGIRLN